MNFAEWWATQGLDNEWVKSWARDAWVVAQVQCDLEDRPLGEKAVTDEELATIVNELQREWHLGGLGPETLYGEFAIEVAKRALAAQAKTPQPE